MSLRLGDTFFVSGTGGYNNRAGAHLMVCVAVNRHNDTAVIVPIVSQHDQSDTSCELRVGDHPFITHDSCASYDFATIISLSETNAKIAAGTLQLKACMSARVIKKFQIGLVTSDETQPYIFNEARGTALMAYLKHRGFM